MGTCDPKTGICETGAGANASSSCVTKCVCGGDCHGDPICCNINMWNSSFFEAIKKAQVEILKEKIKKSWGPMMDKEADLILESMDVKWKSMVAGSKAKEDLRNKLKALMK
jgi:hypothetical protein